MGRRALGKCRDLHPLPCPDRQPPWVRYWVLFHEREEVRMAQRRSEVPIVWQRGRTAQEQGQAGVVLLAKKGWLRRHVPCERRANHRAEDGARPEPRPG